MCASRSRDIEASAQPFSRAVTSFRIAATSTGGAEAAGVGLAVVAGDAAGLLPGVAVVLAVRFPSMRTSSGPLLFLLPQRSHATSPPSASASTVAATVTGMISILLLRGAVVEGWAVKFGAANSVGRDCCDTVAGVFDEGTVGRDVGHSISVGGGSSREPDASIRKVFSAS